MGDLVVITPSRGRPQQQAELELAVHTTTRGRAAIWVGLDDDDTSDYWGAGRIVPAAAHVRVFRGARRSLSGWTNFLAAKALEGDDPPRYLASLGDDHRPRTPDWDLHLIDAIEQLDGPGIAYGNDLFQGSQLPTAWVVSAELVRAVGWMMPPTAEHMYVDTAVLALGQAADRIAYCPSVVIEHLHPLAGKADWDDSYRASNADARYTADAAAYEAWRVDQLPADAATVRALTAAEHRVH